MRGLGGQEHCGCASRCGTDSHSTQAWTCIMCWLICRIGERQAPSAWKDELARTAAISLEPFSLSAGLAFPGTAPLSLATARFSAPLSALGNDSWQRLARKITKDRQEVTTSCMGPPMLGHMLRPIQSWASPPSPSWRVWPMWRRGMEVRGPLLQRFRPGAEEMCVKR